MLACRSVLLYFVAFSILVSAKRGLRSTKFPDGFLWGVSTSAFQIEGAADLYGRGLSQWDEFTFKPDTIKDNSTANITTDHYHHFKEDIMLLKQLKVKSYRLSFSWSRILPLGTTDEINIEGVAFYDNLINALILNNIEPMVTLYHWDLPLSLAHRGGWLNRDTVDAFRRYAEFCFAQFGDRVKKWITINEPYIELNQGYCSRVQIFAPGYSQDHCYWAYFLGSYHLLLAHGYAAQVYKTLFQRRQQGIIGISLFAAWYEPSNSSSQVDQLGSHLLIASGLDLFLQPIFGFSGGYPTLLKERIGARLPTLTQSETELLKRSADFLGINYYYTMLAREITSELSNITQIEKKFRVQEIMKPSKYKAEFDNPNEFVDVFRFMRNKYGNITLFVTENGCPDAKGEGLKDKSRIRYLRAHIRAVAKAITEGSDIRGYFAWSLLDNFEWSSGYTDKFGLFAVDFNDPERRRTPKRSSKWFAKLARSNRI